MHILDLGPPPTRRKGMERMIKAHLDRLPDRNQASSSESSAQLNSHRRRRPHNDLAQYHHHPPEILVILLPQLRSPANP